jgi:hypothetical protein
VSDDPAADFDALFPGEADYFVSGSNHEGEILGLCYSGYNVGVSACEVGAAAVAELERSAGTLTKFFVDSGAFGEVEFTAEGPRVKKAITDREWLKRLALYERLASSLGEQLYCVAPDMVAFQAQTLARLERYAPQVRRLLELGANVIVPVQKGELSMADFAERAAAILGTDEVIWGIPSKKDATSLADLTAFAEYLHEKGKPTRLHLLGLGPSSPRFLTAYSAVVCTSPWTRVFSDSVRITALVGRGVTRKNGTRTPPRPLTKATDDVIAEAAAQGRQLPVAEKKQRALGRVFNAASRSQVQEARRMGWFDPELESAPGVPLAPGCIEYGPGGPFGHDLAAEAA